MSEGFVHQYTEGKPWVEPVHECTGTVCLCLRVWMCVTSSRPFLYWSAPTSTQMRRYRKHMKMRGYFFFWALASSPWQQPEANWSQCKRSKCQQLPSPHWSTWQTHTLSPSMCVGLWDTWLALLASEARVWSHDSSEHDQKAWGSGELTGQVWRSQVEVGRSNGDQGGNAERMWARIKERLLTRSRPDRTAQWRLPPTSHWTLSFWWIFISLWCHGDFTLRWQLFWYKVLSFCFFG